MEEYNVLVMGRKTQISVQSQDYFPPITMQYFSLIHMVCFDQLEKAFYSIRVWLPLLWFLWFLKFLLDIIAQLWYSFIGGEA